MNPSQVHKSYYDRAKKALDDGYYLESVMLSYAAIEGRLEVIAGRLGCPCNRELPAEIRKDIMISHRVECLKKIYKKNPMCEKSKLDDKFYNNLKQWLVKRNGYTHGLYKNPDIYLKRTEESHALAKEGYEFADMLFSEAKRLGRIISSHPDLVCILKDNCKSKSCRLYTDNKVKE